MTAIRLRTRGTLALVALLAVLVLLWLLGAGPEVERVAALAGLGLLVAVVTWELVPDRSTGWTLHRPEPPRPAGQDRVTASWVRLIESHQSTGTPDADLQRRLLRAVEDLVRVRHGTSLGALEPDERRALLGAELDTLLHGPPVRLRPAALLEHLERIERL